MTSKTDSIKDILNRYRSISSDIFNVSVITTDGIMVSSVALSEIDEGLICSSTTAIVSVGERVAKEMMKSKMTQIFVKSEKGYIICNTINDRTVLVSLVNSEAKLGLIFLEINRVLTKLAGIV